MNTDNDLETDKRKYGKIMHSVTNDKTRLSAPSGGDIKAAPLNSIIIEDPLREALKILTPAWPLQNTVAVNPFWNRKSHHFCDVLSQMNSVLHQPLLMPIEFFREKYARGEIVADALAEALAEARSLWGHLPKSVPELVNSSWGKGFFPRHIETISEITPNGVRLSDFVVDEIGKFAAAYFDQNQALIKFPWKNVSFWQAWIKAQGMDRSMRIAGFPDCALMLAPLAALQPEQAIEKMLAEMGVTSKTGQYQYLQRASAGVIGWGSQFCYYEWQKSLGYEVPTSARPSELIAVRLAYDYVIYKSRFSFHEALYRPWAESLNSLELFTAEKDEFFGLLYTWQLALELSYQRQVGSRLVRGKVAQSKGARFQLVFCIDVRSEMIRRHIETVDTNTKTVGFAGFFAAAIDYKKCDEKAVGHRLPVLLTPAISVTEEPGADSEKQLASNMFTSYFRNLRKMPLSSFLFVELFGIISIVNFFRRLLRSVFVHPEIPPRFSISRSSLGNFHSSKYHDTKPLTNEDKAAFAANALRHMGLKESVARVNVLVGHGAETSNNAFASALDCGACGGHAGDFNARFLASLLNSPEVRALLERSSIFIPQDSWFTPAVHETVTDEIYFLDEQNVPERFRQDVADLKLSLKKASKNCRGERQTARSSCLDAIAERRSANWSEVRPEWGLSGNACFVVAPRARTLGVNLSSRAFLHDYDWKQDEEFKTLELIMTAPMVVTNWINMQYFGSVVAPNFYGSGNKVLHNLTNEAGVVEGNGGDLRVGLPIQSVHDGENFVHDPIRLTVFIEAPRIEIEKIIQKHSVIADLVINQWLHIVHVDSDSSRLWRRLRNGSYTESSKTKSA